jgi:dihydroneopterin aldolase
MADKIDNTVDYSIVAEETKNFVRAQSTNLIETLADRLATHLLKTLRIQKVESASNLPMLDECWLHP